MSGEADLAKLLAQLQPTLLPGEFVFCTVGDMSCLDLSALQPIASYQEEEGLSLVLDKRVAEDAGLNYESVFNCISLNVYSSLDAVGLTATISSRLAANDISANVIAAFYHDYVYVPKDKAGVALQLLENL